MTRGLGCKSEVNGSGRLGKALRLLTFTSILMSIFIVCITCTPVVAETNAFESWLQKLRLEALGEGISEETLDAALAELAINPLVLRLDRNQPEFKLSLATYLTRTTSASRVRRGRDLFRENDRLLREVATQYGVQPRFLVAFWGIETDYGRVTGSLPVIEALVTLAYDPRRSSFFRKELLAALHIVDQGQVSLKKLEGSWAGAFGGLQFLPTVFREFAVDYNRDGRIDVWRHSGDLFASGANYLVKSGWSADTTWGREVLLPEGFDDTLLGLKASKRISFWQKKGVRKVDGSKLPTRNLSSAIIVPDKESGRAFMVYNNFEVILKWNRSFYYAIAVGILSDKIGEIGI